MSEVVLVRHAETAWSAARRHTGRTDVPLLPAGHQVAEGLGHRLAGRDFALVLTSPLVRASATAARAGFPEAERDDDLMEWDYGDYEGLTGAHIREGRPDWNVFRHGAPGGETPGDVVARVERVIARAEAAEGDVLLVAHGHLLRALAARWLQAPVALGARLPLAVATLSVLGHEHGERALRSWAVP